MPPIFTPAPLNCRGVFFAVRCRCSSSPIRQSRRFYRVHSALTSSTANRARIPCVSRLFTPLSAFLTSPAGNHYIAPFKDLSDVTLQIGENMRKFLESEYLAGRIPAEGLPLQSGVGNVANAVLASVGQSTIIPPFKMHTEVLQDTVVELMKQGRCLFASSCCIHVCDATLQEIYRNFDFYRDKILLRPVEVSNNPAIARRIGLICMNTALEVDIFGNVNSTHIAGTHIMNGIGGSGDFARSSAYTIFSCPSIAKGGAISSVVPMVSHTDHTEHDVHVIITEQGVADLRGLSPRERAELIIENCAHPDYRPMLRKYLARTTRGHTPHDLRKAFSFHNAFTETGDMRNADLD